MIRSEYARAMRDRGWLMFRVDGGRVSFMCQAVGCTSTHVADGEAIAKGALPGRCREEHSRNFAARVVDSHEKLQAVLRERRLQLGLSQADVDAAAGLSVDHIAKLETQVRLPQFPTYHAWAETLGFEIVLVPKGLPDQTLAIIDQKAGRQTPGRRPPACLLLPDGRADHRARLSA